MNSSQRKLQDLVSPDGDNVSSLPQETEQLRNALIRKSSQLLELSETLRRQQESFVAEREYYQSQIDVLEERVKALKDGNEDLEDHLLQQSVELKKYFALKCSSQERESRIQVLENLLKSLEISVVKEQRNNKKLTDSIQRWKGLVTLRPKCRKPAHRRSQSEITISQMSRNRRYNPVSTNWQDSSTTHLEQELAELREYKETHGAKLSQVTNVLKNEIRKVRLELACALKSKDQLFKYCCLTATATAGSNESFQDVEATVLRVSEVDPSYIQSYREGM